MRLLTGTHETPDGRFVAASFARIVGKPQFEPYAAMGWVDEAGSIRTAVLLNDFNGANIELHLVGSISRQVIRDICRYAFLQLGVQRITAKPYRSNPPLRRTVERIGFKLEGVMKRYYGPRTGDDAMILRLDRDAAEKWIT